MTTLESAVDRVAEARRLYSRIAQLRAEFMDGDYFRNHIRLSDVRGRAYRRIRRRLRLVPVIGLEVQDIERRHKAGIESLEGSFRDLWEHPEFNRGLHSWVEDMFPKEAQP